MKHFLKNKILLNSGRNCLRYILKTYNITEIQIPYYLCPVVRQTIKQENVKLKFYHINEKFLPAKEFLQNEFILYPNYFGLCDNQAKYLSKKYQNLILDNAHAFFAKKYGIASFSSPRKFFNVNDGGILTINKKIPDIWEQDNDRTVEIKDFESFYKNEISIENEPIKNMSIKTKNLLKNINFRQKIIKNRHIFTKIHQKLQNSNVLTLKLTKNSVPMCYPFLSQNLQEEAEIAKSLENTGVYIIKYGTNLPKNYTEFDFTKILMIPLTEKTSKFFD